MLYRPDMVIMVKPGTDGHILTEPSGAPVLPVHESLLPATTGSSTAANPIGAETT